MKVLSVSTIFLCVVFLLSGCKAATGSAAKSQIVQQVEAAGAGDLDKATDQAIFQWLSNHVHVAEQIAPECGKAVNSAVASWGDSTEGRVCAATIQIMAFRPSGPSVRDLPK